MNWINDVVRAVAELPDRNSPENWPEAMIVTADELREIIIEHAPQPEMLTALKALVMLFGHLATDSTQRIWIDEAKAVIAKADGAPPNT